jgi:transcriptional regulator with XRE-family HTH domain
LDNFQTFTKLFAKNFSITMKGADLKAFRKANNLTQTKLGEYLGINKSFISTIESGKDPMPKEKLSKLINNPYGWDTSMLTSTQRPPLEALDRVREQRELSPIELRSAVANAIKPDEKFIIGYLERKIEDKDALIREKDALINELYKQLGKYEAMLSLERKGEIAQSAEDSLSASAI